MKFGETVWTIESTFTQTRLKIVYYCPNSVVRYNEFPFVRLFMTFCDVSGFPLEMRVTKYIVVNVTMDTLITAVILAIKLYN